MKRSLFFSLITVILLAVGSLLSILATASGISNQIQSEMVWASQAGTPPLGVDLDVIYISRSPLYHAYCVEYPWNVLNQPGIPYLCPGTESDRRWPNPGETVTFTAHIINKGTLASPAFDFAWEIDNIQAASGTLPSLAPSAEITTTYQWAWEHGLSPNGQQALGEHTIGFHVDPANAIAETYESNNLLQDYTRGMSLNITMTPEMYAAYNEPVDPIYPYSAEDWLQKQASAMNASFANALYPATPQGSALRVRINHIGIAADPPDADGQHDGGWFINTDVRCDGCGFYDSATDIDWGMVHEWSHQVSLIDLYALGVYASNVFVENQIGFPANVGFGWDNGGIMGGGDVFPYNDHNRYSSHTGGGSNTLVGFRNGYYGSYLFDIPQDNYLKILDNQGNPASQVQVDVYQRTGPWDSTGQMGVDNIPEISGSTDLAGVFHLPNRSSQGGTTTLNGHNMHDNPFGVVDIIGNQGLLLTRLSQGEHEEFHWLDITEFNLAYWMGDVISHTFTITSHIPPAGAPLPPIISTVKIEGRHAILDWQPSQSGNAIGYRVYRATPSQYQYQPASGLLTNTHFEESFWGSDGQHRLYAVTSIGADGKESGFGEFVYAPSLENPIAVAARPSGNRVVLNHGNLYPLLMQQTNGDYSHRLINVHYDLLTTKFFDFDPTGRLILSGFGEFQDERPAVRLYDEELRPLWAFGLEGSLPGEFYEPAGVAWWGAACPFATHSYSNDDRTLLLAHLDGNTTGDQGEIGTSVGVSFEPGKFDQGILLDETDTLTYTVAGNITHTRGALEFWLQPTWDGDDGDNHTLFWWGGGDNFFHLRKDGISNLVFDSFYSGGSCGVPLNVADWQAGDWHHLGLTWDEDTLSLYVDGQRVKKQTCGGTSQPVSTSFYVGSDPGGGNSIEAVIDELRISAIPRVGIDEPCGRILVADSANHRIQAFDVLGNLQSVFGNLGSSDGEFDTPQGVTVDSAGRVFVADKNNNRVVVLSFDGTNFSFLDSYLVGFNAPSGLAVDIFDNLYVADTANNRIVLLDSNGNLLNEYDHPNDGYSGNFNAPRGVTVDIYGNIIIADTGLQRIVTIQRPGWVNKLFVPLILR